MTGDASERPPTAGEIRARDALIQLQRAGLLLRTLSPTEERRAIAILLRLQRRTTSTALAPARAVNDELYERVADLERELARLKR